MGCFDKITENNSFKTWDFTKSEAKWIWTFAIISWCTHVFCAVSATVAGPTRPYIALLFGVDVTSFSFLWTIESGGFTAGVLTGSMVFKRHFETRTMQMLYFCVTATIGGICGIGSVFFGSHIVVFFVFRGLFTFFIGMYTAINLAMFVTVLGPVIQRPFHMFCHCVISCGFFIGTVLVRPFLPEGVSEDKQDAECRGYKSNPEPEVEESAINGTLTDPEASASANVIPTLHGIPSVFWPYLIPAIGLITFSLGFLPLIKCFNMPHKGSAEMDPPTGSQGLNSKLKYTKTFLVLLFIQYFLLCAIESIFMSTIFTFALCGPLALLPADAATAQSTYSGAFLFGRIAGTFGAAFITPHKMTLGSLFITIVAAILMCFVGATNSAGLYAASALVGIGISWQWGSLYSWTAQKMDITGRLAGFFNTSCAFGGMVIVPLVNYIMKVSNDDNALTWAILSLTICQILTYGGAWKLSKLEIYRVTKKDEDNPTQTFDLESRKLTKL